MLAGACVSIRVSGTVGENVVTIAEFLRSLARLKCFVPPFCDLLHTLLGDRHVDHAQSAASHPVLSGRDRKIDLGGTPDRPPLRGSDELTGDPLEGVSDRRCGMRNPLMTTSVSVEQLSFGGSALSCPARRHSAVVALLPGSERVLLMIVRGL